MISDFKKNEFPEPLSLRKLIGPSFVILGLGLGSGELILWPFLASKFGMGIIWGAVVGITFQFFMNMEIERYALARGESVFVGFYRKWKALPYWFILSTFLPWIWPGIVASSAKLLGHLFGVTETQYIAIALLFLIGIILTLGPVLYKTVEGIQKVLITFGVPSIFLLSLYLASSADITAALQGIVGKGDGFWFIPVGLPFATFLGALAYAGAGGNLNLAQSNYVKEKGYGMGKYAGRITSLLTGKSEDISLSGTTFEETQENLSRFNIWWKRINIEHLIIFWLTGATTMVLLALLAYTTLHNTQGATSNISFVINQSVVIGSLLSPAIGVFFLIITGVMLFATQMTVFDATSRILSENIVLAFDSKISERNLPKIYYLVLWLQIFSGTAIFLLGFTEPLQLVITAAVMNAIAMFVHSGLTLWLNLTSLSKAIRTSMLRTFIMLAAFVFYGGFSIYTVIDRIF